ncbi:MAG: hypothetical protein ABI037_01905 [Gemmatimonadales bacterium]
MSRSVIGAAVFALFATALIHFVEAPGAFSEATYKGQLFVANGVGALVSAVGILRGTWSWGWVLGLLMAGGAIAGYIASRTVGLPGIPAEPDAWLEPWGVASLLAEGLFVVLFTAAYRARTVAA